MRIGRWSKLSVGRVCQEHAFGGTLVGISQLSIIDPLIESSIILPLVSVDLEYRDG